MTKREKEAKAILQPLGITICKDENEYCVNYRVGYEKDAYYTNDLEDAIMTGRYMGQRSPRD